MKRILISLLLLTGLTATAQIPLGSYTTTIGESDTYPVTLDSLQKGGLQVTHNRTTRNAIPMARRKEGMYVSYSSADSLFKLVGGVDNTKWVYQGNATKSIVNVEDFRENGKTDDEIIQKAIDYGGQGAIILLGKNVEYTLSNALLADKNQVIYGRSSTIKRGASSITTLANAANEGDTTIVLSSTPQGWKSGDTFQLYINDTWEGASYFESQIKRISGNVITLKSPLPASADGSITAWNAGTYVRKTYAMITSKYPINIESAAFSLKNIKFDGNKSQNSQNLYWYVNPAVFSHGFGSTIENCFFENMSNETIIGQGLLINNCYATNLNGSFVHVSGFANSVDAYQQYNMWITNNYVDNCNLEYEKSGHAEGLITLSFNGGGLTIQGNRFFNGESAILGTFERIIEPVSFGTGKIIFSDNYSENFSKIINLFNVDGSYSYLGQVAFTGGIFVNCGINDWTDSSPFKVSVSSVKFDNTSIINSGNTPVEYINGSGFIFDGNVGLGVSNPLNKLVLPNNEFITFQDGSGVENSGLRMNPDNTLSIYNYGEKIKITSDAVILNAPAQMTQLKLSTLNTAPSAATDTGTAGEIRITAGYIYVCTATNTWVRAALSTW